MLQKPLIDLYNEEYGLYGILGNEQSILLINQWLEDAKQINYNKKGMCLIVSGHCGLGKSYVCSKLAHLHKFEVKHSYACDNRNRAFFQNVYKEPYSVEMKIENGQLKNTKKNVLLIFDDVNTELLNLNFIIDYVKSNDPEKKQKIPIIIICTSYSDMKISALYPQYAQVAKFELLQETHIKVLCNRLCRLKGLSKELRKKIKNIDKVNTLIKESNGDARYFIVNFQFIYLTINDFDDNSFLNRKKKTIKQNIWEIYDDFTNTPGLQIDEIVNMSMMESNWIVNGLYENYIDVFKNDIHTANHFMDYLAISDVFERKSNPIIDYNYGNTYAKVLSSYPYYIQSQKREFAFIDTLKFKFPSYYGRVSNFRINEICTNKLYQKISLSVNFQMTPAIEYSFYFKHIILSSKLHDDIESIMKHLKVYNLDYEDFFSLLRPHIFSMQDLRKDFKNLNRKKLKEMQHNFNVSL